MELNPITHPSSACTGGLVRSSFVQAMEKPLVGDFRIPTDLWNIALSNGEQQGHIAFGVCFTDSI